MLLPIIYTALEHSMFDLWSHWEHKMNVQYGCFVTRRRSGLHLLVTAPENIPESNSSVIQREVCYAEIYVSHNRSMGAK
jgi:hypothetical protein